MIIDSLSVKMVTSHCFGEINKADKIATSSERRDEGQLSIVADSLTCGELGWV